MFNEKGPIFESDDNFDSQDEEQLQRIGLTIEDIKNLETTNGGTSSIVFNIDQGVQPMVLKQGFKNDPAEGSIREYTFLRLLKKREIHGGEKLSPDPFYYNKAEDLLITEKIDGELLGAINDDSIEKIAHVVSNVHKPEFKRPGIPFQKRHEATQYDRLLDQINFLREWYRDVSGSVADETQRENIQTALETIFKKSIAEKEHFGESSFSLIHYDINPGNVRVDKNKLMILLDWRQASIGDRAMDIAKLFFKCNFNENQKSRFFQHYQENIHDISIQDRVNVYYPLVRTSSFLWRLRFLNKDLKKHPEIEQYVNIDMVKKRMEEDYEYIVGESNL